VHELEFEWDRNKAAINRRRHGVSFEEAETVFRDPRARLEYDRWHSDDEERWAVIGFSSKPRLLTVAYVKRDEKIRIITARRATKRDAGRYAEE
jgi:uncharacterized protein